MEQPATQHTATPDPTPALETTNRCCSRTVARNTIARMDHAGCFSGSRGGLAPRGEGRPYNSYLSF